MGKPVLSEIMALQDLSLAELRQRYAEFFPGERPPTANKVYLQRRIAYRLQELAGGGLSDKATQRLQELIQQHDPINHKSERQAGPPDDKAQKPKPLRDRRLPIPGTILTKVYKGVEFQIKVLEKGFEFQGKTYRSLTAVAQVITGAHWNGYLFFNL